MDRETLPAPGERVSSPTVTIIVPPTKTARRREASIALDETVPRNPLDPDMMKGRQNVSMPATETPKIAACS